MDHDLLNIAEMYRVPISNPSLPVPRPPVDLSAPTTGLPGAAMGAGPFGPTVMPIPALGLQNRLQNYARREMMKDPAVKMAMETVTTAYPTVPPKISRTKVCSVCVCRQRVLWLGVTY